MKIMVTGFTGSLGTEVRNYFLSKTKHHVVGYSRDEQKQRLIKPHPRLTMILGDIRDRDRFLESSRNVDLIFHFAALKCVDSLEENPEESISTNIDGTKNVLYAQRLHKIPRVVLTSTDKAAYPVNVYGMCKAISERLVLRNSNNIVCRYGNVLASRGSVVPQFVQTINDQGLMNITDAAMTRFWIPLKDAAKFVIKSAFSADGGLKIPNMKSYPVIDLGYLVSHILGKRADPKFIGIRPGEKIHETLKTEEEGEWVTSEDNKFTEQELTKVLEPIIEQWQKSTK